MNLRQTRRQKGDTIVEVLIAIAVVSSVLGITYSVMNRNLLVMRENQERSEALRLAQAQIESIRNLWDIDRVNVEDNLDNRTFCTVGSSIVFQNSIDQAVYVSGPANDASAGSYEPQCINGRYRIAVIQGGATGLNSVFSVYVRWDNLLGYVSEVRLVYGVEYVP